MRESLTHPINYYWSRFKRHFKWLVHFLSLVASTDPEWAPSDCSSMASRGTRRHYRLEGHSFHANLPGKVIKCARGTPPPPHFASRLHSKRRPLNSWTWVFPFQRLSSAMCKVFTSRLFIPLDLMSLVSLWVLQLMHVEHMLYRAKSTPPQRYRSHVSGPWHYS